MNLLVTSEHHNIQLHSLTELRKHRLLKNSRDIFCALGRNKKILQKHVLMRVLPHHSASLKGVKGT